MPTIRRVRLRGSFPQYCKGLIAQADTLFHDRWKRTQPTGKGLPAPRWTPFSRRWKRIAAAGIGAHCIRYRGQSPWFTSALVRKVNYFRIKPTATALVTVVPAA